jgi:O-antigen/teichoic acid export membrane protein
MPVETIVSKGMTEPSHKSTFFRQSGWMMVTAVGGGVFMYAVHAVAKSMPKAEYGLFTTLLQVVTLMGIPAVGLQSVFAQQAAAALNETQEQQLAGVLRGVLRATFLIWLMMAGVVFLLRRQFLDSLKIENPAALWITVLIGLAALWFPIVMGMLQGRQNFLWLGWTAIFNGVGRFVGVVAAVSLLGGYAAGAMAAVFAGMTTAIALGGWHVRDYLRKQAVPFAWRDWLARVIPLTLGLGAAQFMLSADMIFVRRFFGERETAYYAAAGMIGRALVFFTQPLTAVMFPKVVQSAARAQKTDALANALGITILLGGLAAVGCTVLPSLPLRVVYDKSFLPVATPLVPWFAWCMLPLTLSNVLVNSLMARSRYAAVPWLVAVVVGYGLALYYRHATFLMVIQTLGVFSLIFLGVCLLFSWRPDRGRATQ